MEEEKKLEQFGCPNDEGFAGNDRGSRGGLGGTYTGVFNHPCGRSSGYTFSTSTGMSVSIEEPGPTVEGEGIKNILTAIPIMGSPLAVLPGRKVPGWVDQGKWDTEDTGQGDGKTSSGTSGSSGRERVEE